MLGWSVSVLGISVLESGPVAQLGARLNGIQEVTGSIPVRSTIFTEQFSRFLPQRSLFVYSGEHGANRKIPARRRHMALPHLLWADRGVSRFEPPSPRTTASSPATRERNLDMPPRHGSPAPSVPGFMMFGVGGGAIP